MNFLTPHLHSDTRLHTVDSPDIPFPDGSFDITYSPNQLHQVADPEALLREMARVTTPGGLVAAREVDYGAMTWHPLHPGLTRWRAVFSVVSDLADTQPNAGRHLPTWFLSTGLSDITVSSSNETYASQEEKDTLANQWIQRTQEPDYQQRIEQVLGEEVGTATEQIIAGWNAWKETPGALLIMPHVEVIARV